MLPLKEEKRVEDEIIASIYVMLMMMVVEREGNDMCENIHEEFYDFEEF